MDEIIRKNINNTIKRTDFPSLGEKYEGKVRDNYIKDQKRIIITTDRISAFDVVIGAIPFKGQVLNQIASFWFDETKNIPNHMINTPDPNIMVAKNCKPIPVEMVVRAYLTGVTTTSVWYNYERGQRDFFGYVLPDNMKKNRKFDSPILTPTTKAEHGQKDKALTREDIPKVIDQETFEKMQEMSFKLFEIGSRLVEKQGLILVDTKYEFGEVDGEIMLIDEIHTPDSSRFWFKDNYEELFNKGEEQKPLDKEYVRQWLAEQGFLGQGMVPKLTDEVIIEAAKRYIKAYELITGNRFSFFEGSVVERIRNNLIKKGYL